MIDFLLWLFAPTKFEIDIKAIKHKSINQKSFVEVETTPFDFYFYKIDEFNFNYDLTRKNWITFRGFLKEGDSTFVYLFNEGEMCYLLEENLVLGKVKAKKISFVELWSKTWKK